MIVRGDSYHRLCQRWPLTLLLVVTLGLGMVVLGIGGLPPQRALAASMPDFPLLTGRVVDQAGILSAATNAQLTQTLEQFERDSGRQVVVATVKSLQGFPIEDYGYQLGRVWGIGEKDQNTGAILLVAPNERQVRIEVGYGLEGELTDAVARHILDQFILPQFRSGSLDAGVTNGVYAMLQVLGWQGAPRPQTLRQRPIATAQESAASTLLPIIVFFLIMFVFGRLRGWSSGTYPGGIYRAGGPFRGGGMGGFGGGGGFRGGGGSFGGGGASGRW